MKNIYLIAIILLSIASSCEKGLLDPLPQVETFPAIIIDSTHVTLNGNVIDEGKTAVTDRGFCWGLDSLPTVNNSFSSNGFGIGEFSETIEVDQDITYYVRSYALNSKGATYGNEIVINTSSALPRLTTSEISNITSTSAQCGGHIELYGESPIVVKGICWSTHANSSISGSQSTSHETSDSYTCSMTGLFPYTTYHVRAFATNSVRTGYGEEIVFTTHGGDATLVDLRDDHVYWYKTIGSQTWMTENLAYLPTVFSPSVVSDISAHYYVYGYDGSLVSEAKAHNNYTTYGVLYNGEAAKTACPEGWHIPSYNEWTTLIDYLGGDGVAGGKLKETGIDHWRSPNAGATNSSGFTARPGGEFFNGFYGLSASALFWSSAEVNLVIHDGPSGLFFRQEGGGNQRGGFSVRCIQGEVYLASITTKEIIAITESSASGGGYITSDGGADITSRGICWSTNQNPTITDSKTTDGTGTGEFTSNLTGLIGNTTYYVRAYATNSVGTSYGNEVSFKIILAPPSVTTDVVSSITQTAASSGGNVTDDGGSTITARGVCWSTNQNPTTADAKTTDGTGTGSFTSNLTGLTGNTTYHVRAYATNSVGTSYGAEINFKTSPVLPAVTTTAVSSITQTTASSGGNVMTDGGASITARGGCWSTNQNPTTADAKTTDGTGTGSFTSNLTGLTGNTTYYVRAYATNSIGTAYGAEISIKTSPVLPTVITASTCVTLTGTSSGGNVIDDGGASVTARGVCWSTSSNPTIADRKTADGTGTGVFTSNLIGLTGNTTYFVRAYATNMVGTSYGEVLTFQISGTFTDSRDSRVYNWITICNQKWMSENLAYLPSVSLSTDGSDNSLHYYVYGYRGNNLSDAKAAANYSIYGVLYNWEAAKVACPSGWHLPTDSEWTTLTDYLTNNGYGFGGSGSDIGKSMASTSGWTVNESSGTIGNDQGSNNQSGFTALPGGFRERDGDFYSLLNNAVFWSASASDTRAWNRSMHYGHSNVGVDSDYRSRGFSVRCLKDN